jgi:hypothetical protein
MNMSYSMTEPKELFIMMIIMFMSGLLSSMNIWVDRFSDIRFHLNDIYMALLMCGWCLVFTGIYYININILLIGIIITMIIIYCIRKQIFIDENQYIKGMVPHHSMAVLMSKQLLQKVYNNSINITSEMKELANNIIKTQDNEISYMKFIFENREEIIKMNKYKYKYKYNK